MEQFIDEPRKYIRKVYLVEAYSLGFCTTKLHKII